MLKRLIRTNNLPLWFLFHAVIGVLCSISNVFFILWLTIFALSSINMLNSGNLVNKKVNLLFFVSYLSSLELLGRMTKAYEYRLPWEFGKYMVLFGSLYAVVVLNSRKGFKGYLLFILLLPAMIFSGEREIFWHDIVFNLLGPICIAFAIIAFTGLKMTKVQFRQLLRLLIYPAISLLSYVVVKTPDFDSIEFTLQANFDTTGGYGSNQVSTVLGLGLFLSFIFYVNKWDLTGYRILDLALMFGFAFQGLLSFSRGGVIGGLIGILAFVYLNSKQNQKTIIKYKLPKFKKYFLPIVIGLVLVFQVADTITGGVLSLRYSGENNSTLRGKSEVNINTFTTGRFELFLEDLEIWKENFIMGSGAGVSQWIRADKNNTARVVSHVELSRLLAEHGLFGLTWTIVILLLGKNLVKKNTNIKYQGVLLSFFVIAIYTTFHAATRMYVTPLLIGISLVDIIDISEPETQNT